MKPRRDDASAAWEELLGSKSDRRYKTGMLGYKPGKSYNGQGPVVRICDSQRTASLLCSTWKNGAKHF